MNPISQKLTILRAYLTTRYLRRWRNREAFERWQEKKIIQHIHKIRNSSNFYRQLWKGIPSSRWREFPLIDKKLMMEHFDQLNTVGIHKSQAFELAIRAEQTRDFSPTINGITVGLSSGTSGNRGVFLVSKLERFLWAGTVMAKVLPGTLFDRERIAFFLRADSQLYQSVQGGRIRFNFFDMLEPLENHVRRLNDWQPTIVVAPSSMLRMLANAMKERRLSIKPKKIISVAETLETLDRTYMETVFGQPIHQVYQCTEGFLAATCPYGTLHFNEDVVHIEKEYLDSERKKYVPIITDFTRTSQPIIRYRLDDVLTEPDAPCPCGSVFTSIQAINGRCDDIFYLLSIDKTSYVPIFPDFISRAVLIASQKIKEYKVTQRHQNAIEVALQVEQDAETTKVKQQVRSELTALFQKLDCITPEITFADYKAPQKGNKLRRIERKWKTDDIRKFI